MALHNELGKQGEEMAIRWLKENEFEILHCNWRYSYYEIDIVAGKGNYLHFVEVKARHHTAFGNPEDSVTRKNSNDYRKQRMNIFSFFPVINGYRMIFFP